MKALLLLAAIICAVAWIYCINDRVSSVRKLPQNNSNEDAIIQDAARFIKTFEVTDRASPSEDIAVIKLIEYLKLVDKIPIIEPVIMELSKKLDSDDELLVVVVLESVEFLSNRTYLLLPKIKQVSFKFKRKRTNGSDASTIANSLISRLVQHAE